MKRKLILFGLGIELPVLFGIWSLVGSPSSAFGVQVSLQFFPIELINVDDPGDFPEVAAAGFNVVQSYRFEGMPPWGKTDAEAIKYLDAAHKAGLKVEVGMPQEAVQAPGAADEQDIAFIQQRIRTIKDHPAVWVYKLFDEPESTGYGRDEPVRPVNFNNVYNAIKQLDTIHPMLNAASAAIDGTYPYLGVDITMLQCLMLPPGSYPIPWDKLENLREAHRSSFEVLASQGKPFVFAIQAYNLANDPAMWPGILEYNPEAVGYYPTRAEMRFMAYSGIILGAKGISFVCYKTYDDNGEPLEDISRTANPFQWQAVSSVSKELQALSPIFLAPQSQVRVTATEGDAGKEFLLKEYQGKLYLLALNPKDKGKTITFTFSKSPISVKVLGESRTILPQANSFTDDFDGYGVHVYEVAATPGPTIKANGLADRITVGSSDTVTITLTFDVGNYPTNVAVDWWVIASANLSAWYYMDSTLAWKETAFTGNNYTVFHPVYQGPLFNLSSTTVLPAMTLPPGTYYFWFAVDYPADGILNPNGPILYDQVIVSNSDDVYLKDISGKVLIGSPIANEFADIAYTNLVAKEFSAGQSLWYAVYGWQSENSYDFADFNAVVNWLRQNGKSTHMHMLVGPNFYMPEWLVKGTWTNDQLDALLQNMIYSIMDANDNKNKVDVWNVINELFSDNDGSYVTEVIWNRLGWEADQSGLSAVDKINAQHPVFIRKAFQYARDKTNAKLEYRDYEIESNNPASGRDKKHKAVYQLLKHMLNSGIPIDAVGIQGHLDIGQVDRLIQNNELQNTVQKFKALGLEVYITEMDIGTAGQTWNDALAIQQKTDYYNYLRQAINGGVNRIYFWGVADGSDPGWRTDEHPLPWDENYNRKPAYYGIVRALEDTR